MLRSSSKVFIVPKLDGLLLLVALTGFVCTHKIQAEEDCILSSHILCYECDSRQDQNCADPFTDFGTMMLSSPPPSSQSGWQQPSGSFNLSSSGSPTNDLATSIERIHHSHNVSKKFPPVATCNGCCVKITSKAPDGASYVKRTCLTNLQINYFMVGLICMKESGARGKMCFCETDYCNGQLSHFRLTTRMLVLVLLTSLSGWMLANFRASLLMI